MTNVVIGASIAVYLVGAFLAWGLTLGSFTHEFPDHVHWNFAAFIAIAGPLGLLVALIMGDGHFRLRPASREERKAAFERMYSSLRFEGLAAAAALDDAPRRLP